MADEAHLALSRDHLAKTAADFAALAERYCRLLETLGEVEVEQRALELSSALADLLAAAERLPRDVEPDRDDDSEPRAEAPDFDHGTFDLYYEVVDPFADDGLAVGSLGDNLADIYRDLQEGIALWERGHNRDAIWEWSFSFDSHWGDHLVDALRILRRVNAGRARDIAVDDPKPSIVVEASARVDGAPGFAIKLSAADYQLNIWIPASDLPRLAELESASKADDGVVRLGQSAGASVIWSFENGLVDVLVGQDEETWDFSVTLDAQALRRLREALREASA